MGHLKQKWVISPGCRKPREEKGSGEPPPLQLSLRRRGISTGSVGHLAAPGPQQAVWREGARQQCGLPQRGALQGRSPAASGAARRPGRGGVTRREQSRQGSRPARDPLQATASRPPGPGLAPDSPPARSGDWDPRLRFWAPPSHPERREARPALPGLGETGRCLPGPSLRGRTRAGESRSAPRAPFKPDKGALSLAKASLFCRASGGGMSHLGPTAASLTPGRPQRRLLPHTGAA